jgi:hypothetical protein
MFITSNNMKHLILICAVVSLSACSVKRTVIGFYEAKGKDYVNTLTLNKDSTFLLHNKYFEADSRCSGKWSLIHKDTIILACDPQPLTEQIAGGYINERVQKVIIVGNNRLQFPNTTTVLKKTTETK